MSSLYNLSEFLTSKKFSIIKQYSINGICEFMRLTNNESEDFILSIGKRHNIECRDSYEIVNFIDTNRIVVKIDGKNSYGEINSDGIEEDTYLDPHEVDRMMDQYQAIDLDTEKSDILRENISGYKNQLERLKFCTNNIKYKLCIVTKSSICYIDKRNSVECFAIKKSNPKVDEVKNLCVVVDIETFFDIPDSIVSDIKRVTKNLHNILGAANTKQTVLISQKIKQLQSVNEPLNEKYSKKEKYQKSIDKLTIVVVKIKKQERDLLSKISKLKKESQSTNIGDTERKVFLLKNAEDEYTELMKFKNESVNLLSEIKLEYNNFILDFDYALFDTLRLFNCINSNLGRIGVVKCKK